MVTRQDILDAIAGYKQAVEQKRADMYANIGAVQALEQLLKKMDTQELETPPAK